MIVLLPDHPYIKKSGGEIVIDQTIDGWSLSWRDFAGMRQDQDYRTYSAAMNAANNLRANMFIIDPDDDNILSNGGFSECEKLWL